jgi:putative peptide zinc metalloprotease protein
MAAACFISWITVPVGKFIYYLATSPKLERNRPRAVAVSLALLTLIVGVLQFVPFPSHFRAPGVTQATQWTRVINEAPGEVIEILAPPGGRFSRTAAGKTRSVELGMELGSAG